MDEYLTEVTVTGPMVPTTAANGATSDHSMTTTETLGSNRGDDPFFRVDFAVSTFDCQ